jgi:FAD/FMN-containing dehydrogenase
VSSGGFSTLGGNIATKAGGLRSIKYGNADESVKSLKFVCPSHGLVDTSLNLPSPLEQEIVTLRKKLIEDESSRMWLVKRKGLKSSSGYNLHALIDYDNPADIVTHLMAGSVGTLGVFTQLTVKLEPVPAKRFFCVAFFKDILDAVEAAPSLVELHPSALEAMDSFGTDLIRNDIGLSVPSTAGTTLLVEWDEQDEERLKTVSSLLAKSSLDFSWIEELKTIDALWKIRWTMLTRIKKMHEDAEHRYLSFVDDMAVPLQRLHPFMREIKNIFHDEGLDAVIFGHIGEGNLHIRPLIGKRGWQRVIQQVGERCFTAVLSHGGTLTAEHGTGRNRAPYLKQEWGEGLYPLFRAVKHIFDAEDVLNRGVMFTSRDITHNLRF